MANTNAIASRFHRAGRAMLLTGLMVGSINQASADSYHLTVVEGAPSAKALFSGDIRGAADALDAAGSRTFGAETNRCVAHTLLGNDTRAVEACTNALELRPREDNRRRARLHAVALSNLGVSQAMAGDTESAAEAFRAASNLRSGLEEVSLNRSHLAKQD